MAAKREVWLAYLNLTYDPMKKIQEKLNQYYETATPEQVIDDLKKLGVKLIDVVPKSKQIMTNKELIESYPKIFDENQMSIGWEIPEHWVKTINWLCNKIQNHIDENNLPQVQCLQMKEKFGGLRFYTNWHDDQIEQWIKEAEQDISKICERCGSREDVQLITDTWWTNKCKKCREE